MLTKEELEQSPLFENISYDEYRRMLSCFQAVQKSFRPDELIYDFSAPGSDAVGIVERGDAVLIRIDEDGVYTAPLRRGVYEIRIYCEEQSDICAYTYAVVGG